MTDSSTWLVGRARFDLGNLRVLYRGDPVLMNAYHVLIRDDSPPAVRTLAREFTAFLAGPEGQKIMADFGRAEYGHPLYRPAAEVREP